MGARLPARAPRRVRVWLGHHGWSLRASVRRLAERPLGTVLTVAVMGFALALPVVFWLLLWNAQHVAGTWGQTRAVSVFLSMDADADAAAALAAKVRAHAAVAEVAVRTPQQGLAELASLQGFTQALGVLKGNPLPWVLVVTPRAGATVPQVRALAEALRADPAVGQVQDSGAWQQRLQALLEVGRRAATLLAALLALAAVLVVGNGVRLDIEARAAEIGVLKLVGASPAFIRRVYVYAGCWYGLASGLAACALTVFVEWLLAGPLRQLAASYGGQLPLGALPLNQLAWVPVVAVGLGWLGARMVSGYWVRRVA